MKDLFVSHVDDDAGLALELAGGLESEGYGTRCYELDNPGRVRLAISGAVRESRALLVIVSPRSLAKRDEVGAEITLGHERNKYFVPLQHELSDAEWRRDLPEGWRTAFGEFQRLALTSHNLAEVMERLQRSLRSYGIEPVSPDYRRVYEIRNARERWERREAERWDDSPSVWRRLTSRVTALSARTHQREPVEKVRPGDSPQASLDAKRQRAGGIFICYRRDDDQGFSGRLFDHLVAAFSRERVFMDVDSIDPGLDFAQVLQEEVARCDVFLAVIGRDWATATDKTGRRRLDSPTDYVRIEIEAALNQGKRVIPVLVSGASPPEPEELPDSLKPLPGRQAVQLTHERFAVDTTALIRKLTQILRTNQVE